MFRETQQGSSLFRKMEGLKDRTIRGDLARAVVQAGWNLNELRPAAMTLEEIFLQLTGGEKVEPVAEPAAAPAVVEGVNQ